MGVRSIRQCSRATCERPAVATLTYDYGESTVVLGPLAAQAHPHAYDLCKVHSARLTVPRGWDVVRLQTEFVEPEPSGDDLMAIADAVREASRNRRRPKSPAARDTGDQRAATAQPPSSVIGPMRPRPQLRVIDGDGHSPQRDAAPRPPGPHRKR